jgi:hypothetical protein
MRWEQGDDMAKPDAVLICIGTYPDEVAARADDDVVKDLHAAGGGRDLRRRRGHQ